MDGVDHQLGLVDLNKVTAFLGNHLSPVGRQRGQFGLQFIPHCLPLPRLLFG